MLLLFALTGAAAGLLAGLLGIGGGLLIIPVLVFLLPKAGVPWELVMHMALATSLATICLTSVSSFMAHQRRGSVLWRHFARLAPWVLAGALGGAWLADRLDTLWLARIFGVFAILMAIKMFLNLTPESRAGGLGWPTAVPGGLLCGAISALAGIGGGTLLVPFLVWHRTPMLHAVGTTSALGLPLALSATAGYITLGLDAPNLPAGSLGYVYLPAFAGIVACSILTAPLGARLAHQLPAPTLKKVFAVVLVVAGIKIFSGTL